MEEILGGTARVEAFWADHFQKVPIIYRNESRDKPAPIAAVTDAAGEDARPSPPLPWPPVDIVDMEELWANAMRHAQTDANALLTFRDGKQTDIKTAFFAYAHDCSVVVNKADRFSRAILSLCERLQAAFPFVFCNVYLTPPGSQTVRAHSDDREVLAIQLLGRKQWKVYGEPPVRLPYKHEEVGKAQPFDETTLPLLIDDEVRVGDVLYVPRGYVHQARTPSDSPSLHLTMAIQTSDWDLAAFIRGGVSRALQSPAVTDTARTVASRTALLAATESGAGAEAAFTQADRAAFTATLQAVMEELSIEACAAEFAKRLAGLREERAAKLPVTLRPVVHPLTLSTLLLWNGEITVVGMESNDNASISSIKFVGVMKRGDGQTMPLSLSPATKNVIAMMTTRHTKVPAEVGHLPLPCPLQRLATANWLLRNGCFVRVN
jgi:hypothetical protein